jgi:hypothetical protein
MTINVNDLLTDNVILRANPRTFGEVARKFTLDLETENKSDKGIRTPS